MPCERKPLRYPLRSDLPGSSASATVYSCPDKLQSLFSCAFFFVSVKVIFSEWTFFPQQNQTASSTCIGLAKAFSRMPAASTCSRSAGDFSVVSFKLYQRHLTRNYHLMRGTPNRAKGINFGAIWSCTTLEAIASVALSIWRTTGPRPFR